MSLELVAASSAITLALVFYTIGVFSERRAGFLKKSHVILFWCGLTSGATGFGIHAISGLAAIILMLIHAVWATATFLRRNERAEKTFHTFSTLVWLLWLVPYIIGLLVGIPAIHLRAVCAVGTSVIVVSAFAMVLFRRAKTRKSH